MKSGFLFLIGPVVLSNKYGDHQSGPVTSRKAQKERTVYSKEQKHLLQEHFDKCQFPDRDQCLELAALVGVKEMEIKVCLSLFPHTKINNVPFPIRHINFVLKCLEQC